MNKDEDVSGKTEGLCWALAVLVLACLWMWPTGSLPAEVEQDISTWEVSDGDSCFGTESG